MEGLLCVMKPGGLTSFQVVSRVRRALGERRVGHTGTLDPLAMGVLPLCIGRATKLAGFISELPKTYRAEMRFGEEKDTYDASGRTLRRVYGFTIPRGRVLEVLSRFRGEVWQVPPMVSAVHFEGRRLYELAREGREVPRRPRRVIITELEILSWLPDPDCVEPETRITFQVTCSKGTYIRSLCHDIGRELGVGAYLHSLVRTAAGGFSIEEAHGLEEIEAAAKRGYIDKYMIPLAKALTHLPAVTGGKRVIRLIANGTGVDIRDMRPSSPVESSQLVRVISEEGDLVAIARLLPMPDGSLMVRPLRVI